MFPKLFLFEFKLKKIAISNTKPFSEKLYLRLNAKWHQI